MNIRIIARLDVKPPWVVKPVHFEGLRKMGKPGDLAKRYYEQGADEIIYIDIVSSLYQREILYEHIQAAGREILVPFAVGGGVRSVEDFSKLFHCGADKVAINTYALQHDPEIINRAARVFGSQAVLLHIQAKQWGDSWECYTDCGRIPTGRDAVEWAKEAQERGAGEILVSSIDTEGRQRGFDIPLLQKIKSTVQVPVIAGSGAGSVEDIVELVRTVQPDAVALASVLHYGTCTVSEVKKAIAQAVPETVGV
ncbi:MAG: imidazole glycerol phosphate synthase subunit HisF [Leptospiraceae bacterium]|nr:imidazole glycerol phosphate synthase subunit HisF [Leptospiraceae bacterium]